MYNPNIPCHLPTMFNPAQYDILGNAGDFIQQTGKYPCVVAAVEMVAAKGNAAAHYLQVTFEITGGELKGSRFVDRLNLNNPSQQAREIAYKKLTSLAHATGVSQATNDARAYVGRPLQAYVLAEQTASLSDPNKTVWNNDVKEYFYADGNQLVKGSYGSAGAGGTQVQNPAAAPAAPQPTYAQQPPAAPAPAAPAAPAPQPQIETNVPYAPQQPAEQQLQQQPPVQQQQQAPAYAPPPQQPQQPQVTQQTPAGPTGGYVPPAMPNFQAPQ